MQLLSCGHLGRAGGCGLAALMRLSPSATLPQESVFVTASEGGGAARPDGQHMGGEGGRRLIPPREQRFCAWSPGLLWVSTGNDAPPGPFSLRGTAQVDMI